MSTIEDKKKLLKIKKSEVEQLEEEIAALTLEQEQQLQKAPSLPERFPIGLIVRLVDRN